MKGSIVPIYKHAYDGCLDIYMCCAVTKAFYVKQSTHRMEAEKAFATKSLYTHIKDFLEDTHTREGWTQWLSLP